jgi:predicted nucleic acid-binding protein
VIVVADTSVVLNLCLLGHVGVLSAIFAEISCPPEVAEEFSRLAQTDARFAGLSFPSVINQRSTTTTPMVLGTPRLHAGERAALALSLELGADAVLIDERAGRLFAKRLGIRSLGLLGILVEARRRSLIGSLAPLLDRLDKEARFWMSETLKREVLALVGE